MHIYNWEPIWTPKHMPKNSLTDIYTYPMRREALTLCLVNKKVEGKCKKRKIKGQSRMKIKNRFKSLNYFYIIF